IRIGFADAREGSRFTYNIICPVENRGPQKYLDALKPLGIKSHNTQTFVPISASNREYANSLLEDLIGRRKGRTIIAFCPMSTWPHKTWPITHWSKLAKLIADKCHIIALGAPSDFWYIDRISLEAGVSIFNLAGKTTLGQAAAILDIIDLVVGLDSGLLHIALALGKPSVGIFGPTRWQYLTTFPNFIPLAAELPCAPCCKKKPKCVDFRCIKSVLPDKVADVINMILSGARSDEFNRIAI
ncbi:MAG: glycosyltransferase family 9 protein, partial [Armatimonadota bacterium]|nr:glycosyltransferase family 9 protein [Armatimonadota bacterium]